MTDAINAKTLQQIKRYISDDNNLEHIPQPMFIIGSDGSGKSTLLYQLIEQLDMEGWENRVHFFDGKQFFNSQDIIGAMEQACQTTDRSKGETHDLKRQIVIIDDIDFFFARSDFNNQYELRNYLNREEAPLLIASASKISENLADYQAPFFEGVRVVYVPSIKRIPSIMGTKEEGERLENLLQYLPPVVRSVKTAKEIIALSDNPDNDLPELVKRGESLYKLKLGNLPVNSQKILYAIANSPGAASLSELKDMTGLPSGTLSTYLLMLVKSGDIHKTDTAKRGAPYEINDKLFRLWLSDKYSAPRL
ncbi:MAG: AAA family ATPase [Bacteroides sp.]|nr:AAA family ATPase [Bacteroides sp.]